MAVKEIFQSYGAEGNKGKYLNNRHFNKPNNICRAPHIGSPSQTATKK